MKTTDHGHDNFVIKAYIISLLNHHGSTIATRNLLHSIKETNSKIQPFIIQATTPDTIRQDILHHFSDEIFRKLYGDNEELWWTWPTKSEQSGIDFSTGLYKKAYVANNQKKVMAASISHMRLWQHCIDINEPIMILEHDAIFQRQFKYKEIALCGTSHVGSNGRVKMYGADPIGGATVVGEWTGGICGLNDPRGATRKAGVFHAKARSINGGTIVVNGLKPVPHVDSPGDLPLPSGLAGNSAYIIKPWAAKKLLNKTLEIGVWPNDALMCQQFFPWIQIYFPYHTKVQLITSTTTT